MANGRARGRPIAPLELSAEERAYLERQVRRHRVARSLSERCRIILRCADGSPSKSIATELGRARTHGWQMAAPLLEGSLRWPV